MIEAQPIDPARKSTLATDVGLTIGVEEEYLVVDAETFELRPRGERVLEAGSDLGDELQPELHLAQVEIGTPVCRTLDEVRDQLVRLRRRVQDAAAAAGCAIAASGTHPFTPWLGQSVTPKERYLALERDYGQLAREQIVCGCHVHVAVPDREMRIAVVDRVGSWLSTLIALSANSPFWEGVDTDYSSYRTQVFGRWPSTGTPAPLGTWADYERVIAELVQVRAIEDGTFLYWDVRPSMRYDTVEIRAGDVCMEIDDAVAVAALARALVRTAVREELDGLPRPSPRAELLRAARWRAARYGLRGELVDVAALRSAPAADVVSSLLAHVRSDLEEHGEWDVVRDLVAAILTRGNGARRQRDVFRATGDPREVARLIVERTAPIDLR